jgi:hypothetical protein
MKKNAVFLLVVFSVVLGLTACDDAGAGSTGFENFEGEWTATVSGVTISVTITGNTYTMTGGGLYDTGTFTITGNTGKLYSTFYQENIGTATYNTDDTITVNLNTNGFFSGGYTLTRKGGGKPSANDYIGTWTGTAAGTSRSYEITLIITSAGYDFYGAGTRDEGTFTIGGNRITFTSTMGDKDELGWATVNGDNMAFNVTNLTFVRLYGITGAALTKQEENPQTETTVSLSGFPNGYVLFAIQPSNPENGVIDIVAAADGTISGGAGTFELLDEDDDPWIGSGSYYILIMYSHITYYSKNKINIGNTIVYSTSAFNSINAGYDTED